MANFGESFPVRVSVMTFNVWGRNLWPERAESLLSVFQSVKPDVILLQEVTPEILTVLDESLTSYQRIDCQNHLGWSTEGNIYWQKGLFNALDHGFSDLEMDGYPHRGLFWVRLAIKSNPNIKAFFSTAHFPWPGCSRELETGVNQRIPAAMKVCEHLRRLIPLYEPAVFAGDFNEDFHPLRVLNEEMGFSDVFENLDQPPPPTHPVRPSHPGEEMKPSRTIDWITVLLPERSRVVSAFVKSARGGGRLIPPSDHMPVVAVLELGDNEV